MISKGVCGRADLLRALAHDDTTALQTVAKLLGYAIPDPIIDSEIDNHDNGSELETDKQDLQLQPDTLLAIDLTPTPFWRAEVHQTRTQNTPKERKVLDQQIEWDNAPATPPLYSYLASWRELQPRLRRAIFTHQTGSSYDWQRIVEQLGEGQLLKELPKLPRPGLGTQMQVIVDRSQRLTPYWYDQDYICTALDKLFPNYALDYLSYRDGELLPKRSSNANQSRTYSMPPEGSLVLILGDLGGLAKEEAVRRTWEQLGCRLRAANCRTLALLPDLASNLTPQLSRYFDLLLWQHRGQHQQQPFDRLEQQAEHLLCLLSPALRIEPGLLRSVRMSVGFNAGAESLFWQHPALISKHSVAATLDPKSANQLRTQFTLEKDEVQGKTLTCIREWRNKQQREIWFEELLGLSTATRNVLPVPKEYELACRFFEQFSQRGRGLAPTVVSTSQVAWFSRTTQRLPDATWSDDEIGPMLQKLDDYLHNSDHDYQPDHLFDPSNIPPGNKSIGEVLVQQHGGLLTFQQTMLGTEQTGIPLVHLQSQNGLLRIEIGDNKQFQPDRLQLFKQVPSWVEQCGRDAFGPWLSFSVPVSAIESVTQRLRWIVPGKFKMGSPRDESGRFGDEGPQHQVAITEGYWLFDTPCTQALWEAVMGENPSYFKSPTRPVERVSWKDCQQFLQRLNERIPGLKLGLPSEAQWEYACRAESETATYAGALEIVGDRNAPALDPIAWYGGNSGIDFELENGYDSTDWKEKQYEHTKAGTHPVGQKQPNQWGLYDMLGNVDEWCKDGKRDYTNNDERDPLGPEGGGRVIRGGSWYSNARGTRCACRGANGPDSHYSLLGFRCSRVQS